MHNSLILFFVVAGALIFDFTNGFHDTANSVAPTIATGALRARTAVLLSAVLNLVGAYLSLKVAATIASSIVDQTQVTLTVVLAGLAGAIAWNITTWYFSLPSSSSHALVGGVVGAMWAKAGSSGILWHGIVAKIAVPGIIAPVIALGVAAIVTLLIRYVGAKHEGPHRALADRVAQISTLGLQSVAHGTNDAQKTMGVITLALIANGTLATGAGAPSWVVLVCALAMGLGTMTGGWRIIRTLGHGLTKLDNNQGIAAQLSSAIVILSSSHVGLPLSTTFVATGSVVGTGVATRGRTVRWSLASRVIAAWLVTLPAAGLVGALSYGIARITTGSWGCLILIAVVSIYLGLIVMRARRNAVTAATVNDPWKTELEIAAQA